VGGTKDVGDAVDVDVPQVGVNAEASLNIRLGKEPATSVLLPVTSKGSRTLPLGTIGRVSRTTDVGCRNPNIRVVRVECGDLCGSLIEIVTEQQRDVSEFSCSQQLWCLSSDEVAVENGAEARRRDVHGRSAIEHIIECLHR
jgi:hypothetical protein